tara:strand:+ start:2418 stop:2828 length:411 start_codon:yes stop_codon:yes gene_type:complete
MKNKKLSWHSFLIVLLVIILLGCLVYYLEQNKILENFSTLTGYPIHEHNKAISEGFNNLTFASAVNEGSTPNYVNPLNSYEKNNCGPIDVNHFFKDLKFKPECCGNPAGSSYSNSDGCACMCPEQWKYLNSRGGNR